MSQQQQATHLHVVNTTTARDELVRLQADVAEERARLDATRKELAELEAVTTAARSGRAAAAADAERFRGEEARLRGAVTKVQ